MYLAKRLLIPIPLPCIYSEGMWGEEELEGEGGLCVYNLS